MKSTALVLMIFALSACNVVTIESPPGEPVALDAAEWDGTWLHQEAAVTVRVTDAKQGQLEAAWIEEKRGKLAMESVRGQIRQAGDWQFVVMGYEEETGRPVDPPRYLFARIRNESGRILLWSPAPGAFHKAVEAEVLSGRVEDDEILLPAADDELVDRLIERGPELFDWEQPLVLIRLSD